MVETPYLRFERSGPLGIVVLDRQEALNALDHAMVRTLSAQLAAWKDDPQVAAVVVRPVPGRAFCAGGDIREIVHRLRCEGVDAAWRFFHDEYRLNWRIKHYPKPYIAVMNGITMGGGVGISIHGSHRIVTENTVFAMPETGIGFFPDVGGSYFLPRLPGEIGMFLGLTGHRLRAPDCLYLGLATHHLPAAKWPLVEETLAALPADALARRLDQVLLEFCELPGAAPIEPLRGVIDACFAQPELSEVFDALAAEKTGFGAEQLKLLGEKSPLSLHVTFRQLRRGRSLDFDRCMQLEYRIVRRFLECGEFAEGVRAAVLDRDRRPRWSFSDVRSVPPEVVEAFFAELPGGDLRFDWT